MLLIISDNTDVYFNLAAEDHLLHQFSDDILMLWRSRKAAVCGKHQNICAEINYGFCKTHGIDPARRLTGGGTVYHDEGNVNFTFIRSLTEGIEYAVDYRRFLEPIREALLSMGIQTEYSSRNDLLLNGKKISGNAEHVLHRTKRVLHHGTLLFNSDLISLGSALHPEGVYTDKAVKSVRSEVTNIAAHTSASMDTEMFISGLEKYFSNQKHTNRYVFNSVDLDSIQLLRSEKYANPDWIIGYSPNYILEKNLSVNGKNIPLKLQVSKGIIENIELAFSEGIPGIRTLKENLRGKALTKVNSELFAREIFGETAGFDPYILF